MAFGSQLLFGLQLDWFPIAGLQDGWISYVLPAMLHRFQASHPGVRLSVRSGHSEEVLEMVELPDLYVTIIDLVR